MMTEVRDRAPSQSGSGSGGPAAQELGLADVLAVWSLLAGFALAVMVTYSRVDQAELYNVSRGGVAGGAGRALVFLGFPVGLAAIAVIGVVFASGDGATFPRRGRLRAGVALLAVILCATAAFPGVVDEGDLDAKPVNALAGIGVAVGVAFTLWEAGRRGVGSLAPWTRLDAIRLVVAGIALAAALPWLAAELGFASDSVPLLRHIFLAHDLRPERTGLAPAPAVHAGDHHGLDGVLLVLTVLALSRTVVRLRPTFLRALLYFYLTLGLLYGLANAVQDWWLEQIVKRGWASWEFPSLQKPEPTVAWAGLLAATLALQAAFHLRLARWRAR